MSTRAFPVSADTYLDAARRCPDYSYQQAPAFVEALAKRDHSEASYLLLYRGTDLIGAAAVRERSIPVIGGGYAYVAGGPLVMPGASFADALEALNAHTVDEHHQTLRVLAPIGTHDENAQRRAYFEDYGFEPSEGRHHRTFLLELESGADAMQAHCSKYWRRNLRRGQANGFTVTTTTDASHIGALQPLQHATMERKSHTVVLDASFYARLQEQLPGRDALVTTTVMDDDTMLAGCVTDVSGGTAMPLVLASTADGRRRYASYLAQWSSIEAAINAGCTRYDLGGIDPERNPSVYDFKRGLRGEDVTAAGPFEAIGSSARHMLMRRAQRQMRRAA